jgi:FPC/CPF motif-containing protein YcgG
MNNGYVLAVESIYESIDCMVSNAISDIEWMTGKFLHEIDPDKYKNYFPIVPSNLKLSFCFNISHYESIIIHTVYKGEDRELSFTIDEINEILCKIGVLQ